jgi:hypothetical protein
LGAFRVSMGTFTVPMKYLRGTYGVFIRYLSGTLGIATMVPVYYLHGKKVVNDKASIRVYNS